MAVLPWLRLLLALLRGSRKVRQAQAQQAQQQQAQRQQAQRQQRVVVRGRLLQMRSSGGGGRKCWMP